MYEILLQNSTFIIIIVVLVVCIVICFFGDMRMRKSGKIGSLLKKKNNNDEDKIETSENNQSITNNENNTEQQNNNYDINEGLIDFDSQSMFQSEPNNNLLNEYSIINQEGSNGLNQTTMESTPTVYESQLDQNTNFSQNQINQNFSNNYNLVPSQDEFTKTLLNAKPNDNNNLSSGSATNHSSDPIPFDGNLQNDDQINNMF